MANHAPRGLSIAEKIEYWSVPEPNSGCVLWLGALYTNGYGVLYLAGKNTKAHRVNYELSHGPVPAGLVLDHLCRVRSCIRVDHLEAVTQRVNVHRGVVMELQDECLRGHKFTPENTVIRTRRDGRAHRQCIQCNRLRAQNAAARRELARAS